MAYIPLNVDVLAPFCEGYKQVVRNQLLHRNLKHCERNGLQ